MFPRVARRCMCWLRAWFNEFRAGGAPAAPLPGRCGSGASMPVESSCPPSVAGEFDRSVVHGCRLRVPTRSVRAHQPHAPRGDRLTDRLYGTRVERSAERGRPLTHVFLHLRWTLNMRSGKAFSRSQHPHEPCAIRIMGAGRRRWLDAHRFGEKRRSNMSAMPGYLLSCRARRVCAEVSVRRRHELLAFDLS